MKKSKKSHLVHLRKQPNADTRVLLFTLAGGRCEFDNCNRYLLQHHVTHLPGKFAEMAHIVAYSPCGPRGASDLSADQRNDVSNLMLLCPMCHKLVDDAPDRFNVVTLKRFKADHETRIRMLTEAKADKQTMPLVLKATIGNSPVEIPIADMQAAVAPYYLNPDDVYEIDLTAGRESGTDAYWTRATETISERTLRFFDLLRQRDQTNVSVFGLAPIPLLAYLGSCLSNKFPTGLFQRHRDTDDWTWKSDGEPIDYGCRTLRQGTDPSKVALLLALSGNIPESDYSNHMDEGFTVYEIVPCGIASSFDHLRLKGSLDAFRARYRDTLRRIGANHDGIKVLHVFPALPSPAAVAVGLDWMRKTHPTLLIYDKQGVGGFQKALEITYRKTSVNPI